ncbi:hypothetical protein CC78DRAFT_577449 [Lojkania enalia]|uniref:Uncharacterized protein n=1 Tax=Lojkania enalia TaxID=147567 RepID=A0A9P4KEQ0_9PLEO|nr:hypothetical protein CC78DRAFT_577449 [Didymosphaeria enalia]
MDTSRNAEMALICALPARTISAFMPCSPESQNDQLDRNFITECLSSIETRTSRPPLLNDAEKTSGKDLASARMHIAPTQTVSHGVVSKLFLPARQPSDPCRSHPRHMIGFSKEASTWKPTVLRKAPALAHATSQAPLHASCIARTRTGVRVWRPERDLPIAALQNLIRFSSPICTL